MSCTAWVRQTRLLGLVINGRWIRDLRCPCISKSLPVLQTFIFILPDIAESVPCLMVASPSKHFKNCALVPCVKTQIESHIFPDHLQYRVLLYSVPPDRTITAYSIVLQRFVPYYSNYPLRAPILTERFRELEIAKKKVYCAFHKYFFLVPELFRHIWKWSFSVFRKFGFSFMSVDSFLSVAKLLFLTYQWKMF